MPGAEKLQTELQALAQKDLRCPDFYIHGNTLFRLRKTKVNKQGILELSKKGSDGKYGDWQKVIDIDALGRSEGKSFEFASHNFSSLVIGDDPERLLLFVSDGGSSLLQIREVDIKTGKVVEDGFNTKEGRLQATWVDRDHIAILQSLTGGDTTVSNWPTTTYIWKRGTPLEDAKPVFKGSKTDALFTLHRFGHEDSGKVLLRRNKDFSNFSYHFISLDGTVEDVPLPEKAGTLLFTPRTLRHIVGLLTGKTTFCGQELPANTVVAYDAAPGVPEEKRCSIVYIPESEDETMGSLDGIAASKSRAYISTAIRGKEKRMAFEFDEESLSWKTLKSVSTPSGSHAAVVAAGLDSDDSIVHESGLICPSHYRVEYANGTTQDLFTQSAAFDSNKFQVTQSTAISKDGTEVDYLTLEPKEPRHPAGKRPILLTGYGAFGIILPTNYLAQYIGGFALAPWYEAGGSLVIAAIRGGGERGGDWHACAKGANRQRSYDDFIAVAEKLVNDGITSPSHLGVFGLSNGGLLASVMGTQRPDLFGAIVSDVPLTDMLRYPTMGMGAAWVGEYGDPSDPKIAAALRAYSPYHNVRSGVDYPPWLITVSTTDDQVGAGHARKLAARFKDVAKGGKIYFLEEEEGGHGVSDAFKNAKLMTRRVAFLMHYLM